MAITAVLDTRSPLNRFTFVSWVGAMRLAAPVVDKFERLGQAGSGVQLIGQRAPLSSIRAIAAFTSSAQAVVFKGQLEMARGATARVTDPYGFAYDPVLFLDVVATVRTARGIWNGATFSHIVEAQLSLEVQP